MKMNKLILFGVAVLAIIGLLIGGCTKTTPTTPSPTPGTTPSPAPADKTPFKLGILLDKTGFLSFTGLDSEKGLLLGLEELNYEVDGHPIKVISEDAASDAGPSLDKVKKLVEQDKVNLVIGPVNGGGDQAVFHYLSSVGIPRISLQPSDVPDDWDRSKPYTTFQNHGTGQSMAYIMGAYTYKVLGYKTTTVLTADFIAGHLFTEGFKRGFTAEGGKVLNEVMYPPHTNDMVPYYLQLDKNADFICTWWPGSDGFVGFTQYKELGLTMPIVQPEDGGLSASPPALQELKDAAVGCVSCAIYVYTADTPGNKEFVANFQKKYNELPGVFCGSGYSNIQLLKAVIEQSKGDFSPQTLIKTLRGINIQTVTGPVYFPNTAHNVGTYTPMVFKINNKYEPELIGLPIVSEEWTPGGGRLQDKYIFEMPK